MTKSSLVLLMSVLLLATIAAAGCTSNVTPSPNTSTTSTTSAALQLEGTTWKLTSLAIETGMNNTVPNTTVTAKFDDGNITGSSGCNNYGGSYQLNKTEIKIESIRSTLMFCSDPPGVMSQETTYLLLLKNVTAYTVSNDRLTLSNGLGDMQLVFSAASTTT
ncbi:MAG: META domain-containing protein [Euryarchaeota archaeon]